MMPEYLQEKLRDERLLRGKDICPACMNGFHEEPVLPAVCECPCHGSLPAQELQRAA
jgi:hypothetical protein